MKVFFLISLLCGFLGIQRANAQWGDGLPVPVAVKGLVKPNRVLTPPALQNIKAEDEQERALGLPYRFGVEVPVNAYVVEDATQITRGDLTYWIYTIYAPDAVSVNLNFSVFNPNPYTQIWFDNASEAISWGPFRAKHATKLGGFATIPMSGSTIRMIIESPKGSFPGEFMLESVVYGYRNLTEKSLGFGASGACNVNVNCPEGAGWENEKSAVAMVLTSNNTRKCTGSMINNTANDGTPYFLTARHCNTTDNSIFMFNYESLGCTNVDGQTSQILQGCTTVAINPASDFHLLLLDQAPLPEWNVYYAGWSRDTAEPTLVTGIHHPQGDVKKISIDSQQVAISGYLTFQDTGSFYWKVLDWDLGTTEGGSSGSPLFNANKQIIGQLRGGFAACGNNNADYYGRFPISWNRGASPSERLKEWLDPTNSEAVTWSGGSYSIPFYDRDVSFTGLDGINNFVCDSLAQPTLHILSLGADTIETLTFEINDQGEVFTYTWTGNVVFLQTQAIELPMITRERPGTTSYSVTLVSINGLSDERPGNNQIARTFSFINGGSFALEIEPDNYPEETSFTLKNDTGLVVYFQQGLTPGIVNVFDFCLGMGCYTFTLVDQAGDGICCGFGNGNYYFLDPQGDIIASGAEFTDSVTIRFCYPNVDFDENLFLIYPNPVQAGQWNFVVSAESIAEPVQVSIFDYKGTLVYAEKRDAAYNHTLYTPNLRSGVYLVQVEFLNTFRKDVQKLLIVN